MSLKYEPASDPLHICRLVPVPLLRDHHVIFAAAGGDHTLLVTDAGRVFACGRNDSYQLGVSMGTCLPASIFFFFFFFITLKPRAEFLPIRLLWNVSATTAQERR